MNGPRSPKKRQPVLGHLCYTLGAYRNTKCQRHLFDEHCSWSADYPAQDFQFSSQIQCSANAAWDNAAHPPQANAAILSRFNFGASSDYYFLDKGGLNGTVDERPGFRYRSPKMVYVFDLLELSQAIRSQPRNTDPSSKRAQYRRMSH
jgi:hypothetical protein